MGWVTVEFQPFGYAGLPETHAKTRIAPPPPLPVYGNQAERKTNSVYSPRPGWRAAVRAWYRRAAASIGRIALEFSTERQDGVLIVNVSGRIDPKSAGALETAIDGTLVNGDRAVIMDLEQLVYIGNTGLRALRIVARVLRDRGATMAICSPQGVVAAVFAGSGVDTLITVHPTRAAALEALKD